MIPVVRVTTEVISALKLLCQDSFPKMPSAPQRDVSKTQRPGACSS